MPSQNQPTSTPPRRTAVVPDHPLTPTGSTYAILDANALLPPRLSDILFDLRNLYFPRWTIDIETEFLRNWAQVVKRLKGAELKAYKAASPHADDKCKAEKRLNAYRNAVGDEYRLIGYGANHIAKQVPTAVNKGDIHVAQAAILMRHLLASEGMVSDRIFLVSSNVKHLAAKDMAGLGIEVVRPGAFVDLLFQAAQDRVSEALEKTVSDLTNPSYTKGDLLGSLSLHGAKATFKHFCKAWSVRRPPGKERQL
jgi:hypothetical protein